MRKALLLSASACLMLSGCASILQSNEQPATIYSLQASQEIEPVAQQEVSKILEIQRPSLPPGFDTPRIAMHLEAGRRLDYYARSRWASPLDEVVQEFTVQTARRSLPGVIIASPGQGIDADYRLQMKLNDFQPVYSGAANQAPILLASVTFTLVSMPNEKIATSFTIDHQIQAHANTLTSVTAGLEHLLREVEAKAFTTIAPHMKRR